MHLPDECGTANEPINQLWAKSRHSELKSRFIYGLSEANLRTSRAQLTPAGTTPRLITPLGTGIGALITLYIIHSGQHVRRNRTQSGTDCAPRPDSIHI